MKRKLISLITAIVLIATLIPAAAYAVPPTNIEEDCVILRPIVESTEDEDEGEFEYDGTAKTLDYVVFNRAKYENVYPNRDPVETLEDFYNIDDGYDYVLTKGTDYTEAYSDNVNAGTGVLTVTGKGSYTGSLKAYFTIAKKFEDIDSDYVRTIECVKSFL